MRQITSTQGLAYEQQLNATKSNAERMKQIKNEYDSTHGAKCHPKLNNLAAFLQTGVSIYDWVSYFELLN